MGKGTPVGGRLPVRGSALREVRDRLPSPDVIDVVIYPDPKRVEVYGAGDRPTFVLERHLGIRAGGNIGIHSVPQGKIGLFQFTETGDIVIEATLLQPPATFFAAAIGSSLTVLLQTAKEEQEAAAAMWAGSATLLAEGGRPYPSAPPFDTDPFEPDMPNRFGGRPAGGFGVLRNFGGRVPNAKGDDAGQTPPAEFGRAVRPMARVALAKGLAGTITLGRPMIVVSSIRMGKTFLISMIADELQNRGVYFLTDPDDPRLAELLNGYFYQTSQNLLYMLHKYADRFVRAFGDDGLVVSKDDLNPLRTLDGWLGKNGKKAVLTIGEAMHKWKLIAPFIEGLENFYIILDGRLVNGTINNFAFVFSGGADQYVIGFMSRDEAVSYIKAYTNSDPRYDTIDDVMAMYIFEVTSGSLWLIRNFFYTLEKISYGQINLNREIVDWVLFEREREKSLFAHAAEVMSVSFGHAFSDREWELLKRIRDGVDVPSDNYQGPLDLLLDMNLVYRDTSGKLQLQGRLVGAALDMRSGSN